MIEKCKVLFERLKKREELYFFLKYFILILMLFLAIALASLLNKISTESNPFFYQNF